MNVPVTPVDANDPVPPDEQPEDVETGAWQDDKPAEPVDEPLPERL